MKQNDINITTEMIKSKSKISRIRKTRTKWSSRLLAEEKNTLHECTAKQIDNITSNREGIPKWMK